MKRAEDREVVEGNKEDREAAAAADSGCGEEGVETGEEEIAEKTVEMDGGGRAAEGEREERLEEEEKRAE